MACSELTSVHILRSASPNTLLIHAKFQTTHLVLVAQIGISGLLDISVPHCCDQDISETRRLAATIQLIGGQQGQEWGIPCNPPWPHGSRWELCSWENHRTLHPCSLGSLHLLQIMIHLTSGEACSARRLSKEAPNWGMNNAKRTPEEHVSTNVD